MVSLIIQSPPTKFMLVLCKCDYRVMILIFFWGLEASSESNSEREIPEMFWLMSASLE